MGFVMAGVKAPEDGMTKTRQILVELHLNGPMTRRMINEKVGSCNSMLSKLVRNGYVESYKDFNNDGHKYHERVFVTFYRATNKPYELPKRGRSYKERPFGLPAKNYYRDKKRSENLIPKYIAYLEKWGYTVTKKETE
jgi:hypothetical protein